MKTKHFFPVPLIFCLLAAAVLFYGCKGQTGTVMKDGSKGLSGSHAAGQEVFKPLVEGAVARLLAAEANRTGAGGYGMPKTICFVGVENLTAEELMDYREMLYEMIDTAIGSGGQYTSISRRYVEPALRQGRFRMDELFHPEKYRQLLAILEQDGKPFEYLLFAKLTSGTTVDNKNYQRDYRLTLELINVNNGASLKEGCDLSKAYNVTMGAKIRNR